MKLQPSTLGVDSDALLVPAGKFSSSLCSISIQVRASLGGMGVSQQRDSYLVAPWKLQVKSHAQGTTAMLLFCQGWDQISGLLVPGADT